ncbi:MAG TPA: SCO family protein [Pseudonocardiaceae bacterium]|nr:SCO family protein [Pseudonocardiaceae bacterium]
MPDGPIDQDTPEEQIAALVDAVILDPAHRDRLVELLPEQTSLYAGRGTNATTRIRGYLLAAFERVGLPDAALPYVLEELESGRDAYLVAAAAKALRGLERPTSSVVAFLLKAIANIRYLDDAVSFDCYRPQWPMPSHTTAMEEIIKTCAWLGMSARPALPALQALYQDRHAVNAPTRAILEAILAGSGAADTHCCAAPAGLDPAVQPPPRTVSVHRRDRTVPVSVGFEDQDGLRLTYEEFFLGRPSVVVFFYTRCDNPNKCSLTISKLAQLHAARRDGGLDGRVRTAAITYDPGYDLPPRLTAYGRNRGVAFGSDDRFLRTTTGFDVLGDYFELGVNYGPTLVNRHRTELFVLDRDGRVAATFARLQWDVPEVLNCARALAIAVSGSVAGEAGDDG